jgi:hypothetical protein
MWGWPHCMQDEEITHLSVDRRHTLIAFETVNYWSGRLVQPACPAESCGG